MWWLCWIVSILAVIGAKAITTQALLREKFKLEALLKLVAKIQIDERVARGSLELARRELVRFEGLIRMQEGELEKIKEMLRTLDEEKKKRLEKAKQKLTH